MAVMLSKIYRLNLLARKCQNAQVLWALRQCVQWCISCLAYVVSAIGSIILSITNWVQADGTKHT